MNSNDFSMLTKWQNRIDYKRTTFSGFKSLVPWTFVVEVYVHMKSNKAI
jgi:hypothetical protein